MSDHHQNQESLLLIWQLQHLANVNYYYHMQVLWLVQACFELLCTRQDTQIRSSSCLQGAAQRERIEQIYIYRTIWLMPRQSNSMGDQGKGKKAWLHYPAGAGKASVKRCTFFSLAKKRWTTARRYPRWTQVEEKAGETVECGWNSGILGRSGSQEVGRKDQGFLPSRVGVIQVAWSQTPQSSAVERVAPPATPHTRLSGHAAPSLRWAGG